MFLLNAKVSAHSTFSSRICSALTVLPVQCLSGRRSEEIGRHLHVLDGAANGTLPAGERGVVAP